jgi:N-acyl-phosphatidylethanolamine-hydrolysing phospholipase D
VRPVVGGLLLLSLVLTDLSTLAAFPPRGGGPAHHLRSGFQNVDPQYAYTVALRARRALQQSLGRRPPRGRAFDVLANDGAELRANGTVATATWVGHSTFLIQLDGVNVLTDPHWGDRASPVGFAGPRRLVPPGLRFEDLPPIHAVVISHDHYDHLDETTVRRLAAAHRPTFFVPLGIGAWLRGAGIDSPVVELDWWERRRFRGLVLVCTPAQHSSGRTLTDQNRRLWSSWAILGRSQRLFFAGDTGYYGGFREIGERLGPFGLALIPVGGYYAWGEQHPNHVNPEEAVQVFEDVRARLMVPMHWGTFDMNREPFREPPDRLLAEALRRGLEERIALLSPGQTIHW